MCGRYALDLAPEQIRQELQAYGLPVQRILDENQAIESLNIAPTANCPIYCQEDSEMEIRYMKWGLIPGFAKEPMKLSLFNTKAESLKHLKPIWSCAKYRRGIVVMQGYYEWHKTGKERIPYYFKNKHQQLLCVLGIWDVNDKMGQDVHSFSIITTKAARRVQKIHERMPAIVTPDQATKWIHGSWPEVLELIKPQENLEFYRVGMEVNKVGSNGPLNKPLKGMDFWAQPQDVPQTSAKEKSKKEILDSPVNELEPNPATRPMKESIKQEPKEKHSKEVAQDLETPGALKGPAEPEVNTRKRTKQSSGPKKRRTQKRVKDFF